MTGTSPGPHQSEEKLGEARFAVYGNPPIRCDVHPAPSYGTVKGYPMNGTVAPSKTTLRGLYDRAYSSIQRGVACRSGSWTACRTRPLHTCELRQHLDIGGNSGSPVIKGREYGIDLRWEHRKSADVSILMKRTALGSPFRIHDRSVAETV
jgi:hypothetical protein